jgi:hypothetical protein
MSSESESEEEIEHIEDILKRLDVENTVYCDRYDPTCPTCKIGITSWLTGVKINPDREAFVHGWQTFEKYDAENFRLETIIELFRNRYPRRKIRAHIFHYDSGASCSSMVHLFLEEPRRARSHSFGHRFDI